MSDAPVLWDNGAPVLWDNGEPLLWLFEGEQMPYITAEELRDEVSSDVSTPLDEAIFEPLTYVVSAAIDWHCFRTFTVPSSGTARYFKPTPDRTEVDDLDDIASTEDLSVAIDLTGNGTYSETLTADVDYVLETNRTGMVTHIRSTGYFPTTRYRPRSIKVTAKYGWPEVPYPIKRAALIWGIRLYNRKDTPSGVVGFGDAGGIRLSKIDPDVAELIAPFRDRGRLLR